MSLICTLNSIGYTIDHLEMSLLADFELDFVQRITIFWAQLSSELSISLSTSPVYSLTIRIVRSGSVEDIAKIVVKAK